MIEHELRPIERTIRRLRQEGLSSSEVAWRLRRSPGYVERVEAMSAIVRADTIGGRVPTTHGRLRPIERCVLSSLNAGSGYAEIAARLRRSPGYVARVERLARLKTDSS